MTNLSLDTKLKICGLSIQRLEFNQSINTAWEISQKIPIRIFWANAHSVALAAQNKGLKQAMQQAEFLLNDGVGIEIAGKILGQPIKDNLNGTDWIPSFLDYISKQSSTTSVFLLGSKQEVVEKAAINFIRKWPNLSLTGYHHGYFDDPEKIMEIIKDKRPQLLIVGMGVPLQELFIDKNWKQLKDSGVRIAIAGGAILDFISGSIPRAPQFIRNIKCEWTFRLLIEPRRLARRYLIEGFSFFKLVFKEWLRKHKIS